MRGAAAAYRGRWHRCNSDTHSYTNDVIKQIQSASTPDFHNNDLCKLDTCLKDHVCYFLLYKVLLLPSLWYNVWELNPSPFKFIPHCAQRLEHCEYMLNAVCHKSLPSERGRRVIYGVHKQHESWGSVELPVLLMLFNYAVKRFVFLCNDQLSDVSDNSEWWPHAAPALICSVLISA